MAPEVWMVSSEIAPLAQTGGLGHVLRSLPPALRRRGHTVRQFLPAYGFISRKGFRPDGEDLIPLGTEKIRVGYLKRSEPTGVVTTMVVCDELFDRPEVYGPPGGDYPDNARRFALFCRAVCERLVKVKRRPDVVHLHDWTAGLIPVLLRHVYGLKTTPKTVFTIHNLAHQGVFDRSELGWLSLGPLETRLFQTQGMEFYGQLSFLKSALVYSDWITTVSPTYAREILTPEFGCGLDGVLSARAGHLSGILNAADDAGWDPSSDIHIPKKYDVRTQASGKKAAAAKLRREMGMDSGGRPILAMVGRLAPQKGVDLLIEIAPAAIKEGADFCILGEGDPKLAGGLHRFHAAHKGRVGLVVGFDDGLAHRIFAGSDMLLLPSRFEPCGLAQLYAFRYGTVPVVRKTGGLADTVRDATDDPRAGTGFVFEAMEAGEFLNAVRRALDVFFKTPKKWRELRARVMRQDFSWDSAAAEYEALYDRLIGN